MANVQYPGPVRGRLRPIQVDELQAGAEQAAQDVQVPRGDVEVLPAPVQPPQPAENQGAQLVGQAILPAQAQQFPPAQVPAQTNSAGASSSPTNPAGASSSGSTRSCARGTGSRRA